MNKLTATLEQLHSLRHRKVENLSTQLTSQRQLCQRFESNINALSSLAEGMNPMAGSSAALMANHSGYKRNLQRVIDWQKQEQALANLEVQKTQGALLLEAQREKGLEVVLDESKRHHMISENRREQKFTDAQSAQCGLRQKLFQR